MSIEETIIRMIGLGTVIALLVPPTVNYAVTQWVRIRKLIHSHVEEGEGVRCNDCGALIRE